MRPLFRDASAPFETSMVEASTKDASVPADILASTFVVDSAESEGQK